MRKFKLVKSGGAMLLTLLMCLFATNGWGQETTTIKTNSKSGTWTKKNGGYEATINGFTIGYFKGESNNDPVAPKEKDNCIRVYEGAKLCIKGVNEEIITKVVLHFKNTQYTNNITVDGKEIQAASNLKSVTWKGETTYFEAVPLGQIRITSIDITYTSSSKPSTKCEYPEFTPANGTMFAEPIKVKLTTATQNAKIYYTLDQTEPTEASTLYDENKGIDINETTTIKARAYAEGFEPSEVATAIYTKVELIESLKALTEKIRKDAPKIGEEKGYAVKLNDVVISGISKKRRFTYMEDKEAGIQLYLENGNSPYTPGQILNGTAIVTAHVYNEVPRLTSISGDITITSGTEIPCTEIKIKDLQNTPGFYDKYESRRVVIKDATVTQGFNNTNNAKIKQSDSDPIILFDKSPVGYNLEVGRTLDVVCYPSKTTARMQLDFLADEDFTLYPNGDGTFENPYLPGDLKLISTKPKNVWTMGYIVGYVTNGPTLNESGKQTDTNIALAEDDKDVSNFIPAGLQKGKLRTITNVKDNSDNIGKLVVVYGDIDTYFGVTGIKNVSKIYGLNSIIANTDEGFATYYTDCAYEMPAGLTGGLVTGASNGNLTIDYKYNAGDVVPAKTSLLIKGTEKKDYEVVNTNSGITAATGNLLHGKDALDADGNTSVSGTDVKYYILSHNKAGDDFGFYWAAENGAAIKYQAPFAFLAIPSATAAPAYSLRGDNGTTGINGTIAPTADKQKVYTTTGVYVGNSTRNLPKGVYIINGKKIVF